MGRVGFIDWLGGPAFCSIGAVHPRLPCGQISGSRFRSFDSGQSPLLRFRPKFATFSRFAPRVLHALRQTTTFGRSRISMIVAVEMRLRSYILWQFGHKMIKLETALLLRLQSTWPTSSTSRMPKPQ